MLLWPAMSLLKTPNFEFPIATTVNININIINFLTLRSIVT